MPNGPAPFGIVSFVMSKRKIIVFFKRDIAMDSVKKKYTVYHILYYLLMPVIYWAFYKLAQLILDLSGADKSDLGLAMVVTYALVYILTPLMSAVLMRFSLLRWYVNPFAAAELPFLLFIAVFASSFKKTGDISAALAATNTSLCAHNYDGWLTMLGLFAFGLLMSLSFARKNGESISYKIIARFYKE